MQLPLLLAWRFLKSPHEKSIATMLRICFVSIVIGTGSLTLVAAIMNGFEQATHKKLQGIHADLTITAGGKNLNYQKLTDVLTQDFAQAIKATSPSTMYHVMLEAPISVDTYESTICMLRVVDPLTEGTVSSLGEQFIEGTTWSELTGIFMGQPLAKRLQISTGSLVTLVYHTPDAEEDGLAKKKVPVTGFFKTGIQDIDEQVIIAPYSLANEMYSPKVTQVACMLKKGVPSDQVINNLKERLSLDVQSWKELYTPLVAALTLEKYAMWFILMLVTLVASLTIISLLYMYTTHKRIDIAVLTSMGMSSRELKKIFLAIATIITFSATLVGVSLAAVATWLLATYPFIKLPDVYYVTHLPAELTLSIILAVLGVALLVSLCAGLFPHARATAIKISTVLKGMA